MLHRKCTSCTRIPLKVLTPLIIRFFCTSVNIPLLLITGLASYLSNHFWCVYFVGCISGSFPLSWRTIRFYSSPLLFLFLVNSYNPLLTISCLLYVDYLMFLPSASSPINWVLFSTDFWGFIRARKKYFFEHLKTQKFDGSKFFSVLVNIMRSQNKSCLCLAQPTQNVEL